MSIKLKHPRPGMLESISNSIKNNHPCMKKLCYDIQKFSKDQRQTQEMKEERTLCVQLIRRYLDSDSIKNQLEKGVSIKKVAVFGSFATHCASKNSDLDLCICLEAEGKPRTLPVTVLQAVYRDLLNSNDSKLAIFFGDRMVTDIAFISTAKVPIVRFKLNDVHIDLSASFSKLPPRTCVAAKLINGYCQLDDRFAVLAVFIKTWLKSEGDPHDHLRDFPNSYALILMLIHVLQWYGILPNLYKTHSDIFNHAKVTWESINICHEFEYPLDENTVAMHRENNLSQLTVVQLLYLFACQYSDDTILTQFSFNMKTGYLETRQSRDYPLTIIDTYDTRNPARSARSTVDLHGALTHMRRILRTPEENMFSQLLRITEEKLYACVDVFTFSNLPDLPFSSQQAFNQREPQSWKNNTFATPNYPRQNLNYYAYPQAHPQYFPNRNYYAPSPMPMAFPQQGPYGSYYNQPYPMPSQIADRFRGMNLNSDYRQ